MGKLVLPKAIDVAVVSYGGVGTTFLLEFLSKYKNVNDPADRDGYKHSHLPLISGNRSLKFIYVYGNPQMAAISLFGRGYHYPQSVKLQHCGEKRTKPIPKAMTLEEYVVEGIDKLHFREHFYNWHERYLSDNPTLFLRYETIFDHVADICSFLDLPSDAAESFPPKRTRSSARKEIKPETKAGLDRMYGEFERELDALPDADVRQGAKEVKSYRFEEPYLRAYAGQPMFWLRQGFRKLRNKSA